MLSLDVYAIGSRLSISTGVRYVRIPHFLKGVWRYLNVNGHEHISLMPFFIVLTPFGGLWAKRHTTPCLWTRKTDSITNRPRWLLSPSRLKMDYWCLARLVSRVISHHSAMPHGMNPRPPHPPAISETVTGLGAPPSPPTAISVPAHGTNKRQLSLT